jgi:uncharacterized protein (TIGR02271 family)
MLQTVIGIFDSANEAQQAVKELVSNGFMRDQIDVSSSKAIHTPTNLANVQNNDTHSNFFSSLFDDGQEANTYAQRARQGSVVTVHAQSGEQAQEAARILDGYGAVDVNEQANRNRTSTGSASSMDAATSLPVIEEELQVGKRVVETGGVRLRSRIIERPVEEHLRLREEHVHVERHNVDRPASESDFAAFKEGVIELTEHAEVPVVNKQMQVVEEVSLNKEVEERTETIKNTLRSTDVEIETLGSKEGSSQRENFSTQSAMDKDASFLETTHGSWQGALRRMKEIEDDYKVAEDDPDVRGWDVVGANGEKLGEVEEMIVDTQAMKVRYLDVEVDDNLLDTDDHHILIPIGSASIDRENKNVRVTHLNSRSVANYPAYSGEAISREYEHKVMSAISPTYQAGALSNDRFYEGEHFDTGRFSGSKRL